ERRQLRTRRKRFDEHDPSRPRMRHRRKLPTANRPAAAAHGKPPPSQAGASRGLPHKRSRGRILNLSKSRQGGARYRAGMASYSLDFDKFPNLQFRIDSFTVPAAAVDEFESAMRRNMAFIQTLPGFQWHQIFEKTGGPSVYNVITIAVWESAEAIDRAT